MNIPVISESKSGRRTTFISRWPVPQTNYLGGIFPRWKGESSGQSKVRQLQPHALPIYEDISWFEVPVPNPYHAAKKSEMDNFWATLGMRNKIIEAEILLVWFSFIYIFQFILLKLEQFSTLCFNLQLTVGLHMIYCIWIGWKALQGHLLNGL